MATKIAFCFPGQGSLEQGMGREFAESVPEAMRVFDVASEVTGLDLKKICFDTPIEKVVDTAIQQPALIAASLAAFAALRAHGIEPDYVVGHSVGEFAALSASDAYTLEETFELVRARGIAMADAAREYPGSMAAILGLEDETVETLCRRILGVWPANYNCPGQIVVSGQNEAVDECCDQAGLAGARRAVKLAVSGAFHSPLVAKAADVLRPHVEKIPFKQPEVPFMSTVTARLEDAQRLKTLLVDQLTAPVKFTQATNALIKDGARTFVEVGPGNVLSGLVKRIDRSVESISVSNLAGLAKLKESLAV